ncbi:uncharacterized protein LOC142564993 [Dermacentor variabilis]|uniref:uncharacterized protein LOC142564993 n=1 Tax=Dermacentor variabilis TaxID=34621 RepID=UPI003F5BCE33
MSLGRPPRPLPKRGLARRETSFLLRLSIGCCWTGQGSPPPARHHRLSSLRLLWGAQDPGAPPAGLPCLPAAAWPPPAGVPTPGTSFCTENVKATELVEIGLSQCGHVISKSTARTIADEDAAGCNQHKRLP